jgi:hypothetical protein
MHLTKTVERNYLHLASLECRQALFQSMLDGNIAIMPELSAKRELPTLMGDYQFSVVAQFEIGNMEKSHDRSIVIRLRDDLIANIIPACTQDCHDAEAKARRRILTECPPKELDLAKTILEKQFKSKALSRKNAYRDLQRKRKLDADLQSYPPHRRQRTNRPPPLLKYYPGPSLQSSRNNKQQRKPEQGNTRRN